MTNMKVRLLRLAVYGVLPAFVAFGAVGTSLAQIAPPDNKASPDIYKEISGNDEYRLVEGTWKPGQRDNFHSHPRMLMYWATDCSFRLYFPDGTKEDHVVIAGRAGVQDAVASHSLENIGKSECRVVMFEPRLHAD